MTVSAGPDPQILMLGTRAAATDIRSQVEVGLEAGQTVCVDFQGVLVSQSFMDELLGVLIVRHGPAVLERLVLRNCHEEVRAAARFVTKIRTAEFETSHLGA
jgi:hypothetical protein